MGDNRGPLFVTDAPFASCGAPAVLERLARDGDALEAVQALAGWAVLERAWGRLRHSHRSKLDGAEDTEEEQALVWGWGVLRDAVEDAVERGRDASTPAPRRPDVCVPPTMVDAEAAAALRAASAVRELVAHPGFAIACERWAGMQYGLRAALEVCDAGARRKLRAAIRALGRPIVQIGKLLQGTH